MIEVWDYSLGSYATGIDRYSLISNAEYALQEGSCSEGVTWIHRSHMLVLQISEIDAGDCHILSHGW